MKVGPPKPSNVVRSKEQVEKLYGVSEDEIEECREWIATIGLPAAMVKTLLRGMDGDLLVAAWCPSCNASVKVRYPDYKAFVAVAKFVTEYKLGKAVERKQVDITTRVVQAREELRGLSDAELLEIAEGEWKALPPAA